jgi:hypothetical protein
MASAKKRGYDRFLVMLVDWSSKLLKHGKQTSEMPENQVRQFQQFFYGFTAIKDAIDNLDLCASFIAAPVPRRKGLNYDRYLRYHLTFYLQEVYILSERLERYATLMYRRRKRLNPGDNTDKRLASLIDRLRGSFGGIAATRGSHVHTTPFDDESLRLVGILSTLAVDLEQPQYAEEARFSYREAKRYWNKKIEANKKAITKLLDQFCDEMYTEMMTSKGEFLSDFSATYQPK